MSDPRWLSISAIDSWMFRDGRPFEQADAGAAEAVSIFPPWPPTVVGAVRAMLWQKALGGNWNKEKLGNGTDWSTPGTLGPLSFTPPILMKDGAPLFPAPLNILRDADGQMTLLRPGAVLECDMGKVRLPAPDTPLEGGKTLEGAFLTSAGLVRTLEGQLPEAGQIVPEHEVFLRETRLGIGIDAGSRRVREGQLYMASHVRPAAKVELAIGMRGWGGNLPGRLGAFGGEHRMAEITPRADEVALPDNVAPNGGRRLVVALSPVVFDNLPPKPGDDLGGLGRVVSACIGRPVRIGGWDSGRGGALPLRMAVPAGSVWYLEDAEGTGENAMFAGIGIGTQWGFGATVTGRWEDKT